MVEVVAFTGSDLVLVVVAVLVLVDGVEVVASTGSDLVPVGAVLVLVDTSNDFTQTPGKPETAM